MGSSGLWGWIIVVSIGYLIYALLRRGKRAERIICRKCGCQGEAKAMLRGSLGIEIVLWLCFLLPGLIYTLWRDNSRFKGCAQCGSDDVVPADSPIGRKLIEDLNRR